MILRGDSNKRWGLTLLEVHRHRKPSTAQQVCDLFPSTVEERCRQADFRGLDVDVDGETGTRVATTGHWLNCRR